jgi:hypothetical protein
LKRLRFIWKVELHLGRNLARRSKYIYKIFSIHLANAIRQNKYGRPSDYSMYSLIDDNDDEEQQTYFAIIMDLINNKVIIYYYNRYIYL